MALKDSIEKYGVTEYKSNLQSAYDRGDLKLEEADRLWRGFLDGKVKSMVSTKQLDPAIAPQYISKFSDEFSQDAVARREAEIDANKISTVGQIGKAVGELFYSPVQGLINYNNAAVKAQRDAAAMIRSGASDVMSDSTLRALKGEGKIVFGTIGWMFSPVTGLSQGIVAPGVKTIAAGLGAPDRKEMIEIGADALSKLSTSQTFLEGLKAEGKLVKSAAGWLMSADSLSEMGAAGFEMLASAKGAAAIVQKVGEAVAPALIARVLPAGAAPMPVVSRLANVANAAEDAAKNLSKKPVMAELASKMGPPALEDVAGLAKTQALADAGPISRAATIGKETYDFGKQAIQAREQLDRLSQITKVAKLNATQRLLRDEELAKPLDYSKNARNADEALDRAAADEFFRELGMTPDEFKANLGGTPEQVLKARDAAMAKVTKKYFSGPTPNVKMTKEETANMALNSPMKDVSERVVESKTGFRLVEEMDAASPGRQEILNQQVVEDISQSYKDAMATGVVKYDRSAKLMHNLAADTWDGMIDPLALKKVLADTGQSTEEFVKTFLLTASNAGRTLGRLGIMKQRLMVAFKDSPEAISILEESYKQSKANMRWPDSLLGAYYKMADTTRSTMLWQVATTMRNVVANTATSTIGAFDESLQSVIRKAMGSENEGSWKDAALTGMNTLNATIGRFKGAKRAHLLSILESEQGQAARAYRLMGPQADVVAGGKFMHAMNTLNRVQDDIFRKISFEAKLRGNLKRIGKDYNSIAPQDIPTELLADATNYALEMTYSAGPKSAGTARFLRAWHDFPLMDTVNPFPRFTFANAMPSFYERSPLGMLGMFKPEVWQELSAGDPTKFAKIASRIAIGDLMMQSAFRIRQSNYAGEKWDQIKVGTLPNGDAKYISVSPFSPFSMYMLVADTFIRASKGEKLDTPALLGMVTGFTRVTGTALMLPDLMRSNSGDSFGKTFRNFIGAYLSRFTVGARTPQDIYAAFDDKENRRRFTAGGSLVAPTMANIPGVSQMLPEVVDPLTSRVPVKGEPVKGIPYGVFRQLTGFNTILKTPIMQELDKLQISWQSVAPSSGIPEADRALFRLTDKPAIKRLEASFKEKRYLDWKTAEKRIYVKQAIKAIREEARNKFKDLAATDPNYQRLEQQIAIKNLDPDMREVVNRKRTLNGLLPLTLEGPWRENGLP